jgi:DNA mismatch repair ATPase MutL
MDRKEYMKEYYNQNKEKIKEYKKEYYENNKEQIKEKKKEYRENNKEKIKEKGKEYRETHKEQKKEENKKYREENKDDIKKNREENKEYFKKYNKTEKGKKIYRISNWKSYGIIHDDFDALYDYYINCKNCENCNVELVEGHKANSRCLDHSHKTGLFRNILCNACNTKRQENKF